MQTALVVILLDRIGIIDGEAWFEVGPYPCLSARQFLGWLPETQPLAPPPGLVGAIVTEPLTFAPTALARPHPRFRRRTLTRCPSRRASSMAQPSAGWTICATLWRARAASRSSERPRPSGLAALMTKARARTPRMIRGCWSTLGAVTLNTASRGVSSGHAAAVVCGGLFYFLLIFLLLFFSFRSI